MEITLDTVVMNPSRSAVLIRYPAHGGRRGSKRKWSVGVWGPETESTPRVRFGLVGMDEAAAQAILDGSELAQRVSEGLLMIKGFWKPAPKNQSAAPPEVLTSEPYSAHAEKVLAGEMPPPLPGLNTPGEFPQRTPLPEPPKMGEVEAEEEDEDEELESEGSGEATGDPSAHWSLDALLAYADAHNIPLSGQQRRSKPKVLRIIADSR